MLAYPLLLLAATALADTPISNSTVVHRSCAPPLGSNFKWCDQSLSVEARLSALIPLINESLYGPLLTARGQPRGNLASQPDISLEAFDWGENSLHGDQTTCVTDGKNSYCPTSFPMPNALGSTWSRDTWREMALVIGIELRALWLAGATEASTWSGRPHASPTTWSPTINVPRDPRWGRYQEVVSGEPFALGEFAREYVLGAQDGVPLGERSRRILDLAGLGAVSDSDYKVSITTLKHFAAYNLEDSDGFTRHNFNAIVAPFDMADSYLKPFRPALGAPARAAGHALGVMCSYNAINGVPTCAGGGGGVLKTYLRDRWQSVAYLTSDTGAIDDIYSQHHYTSTAQEAVAAAVNEGSCDMNSGAPYWENMEAALQNASVKLTKEDIAPALERTMGRRFDLGVFDSPSSSPLWKVPVTVIQSEAHVQAAKDASRRSLVLLKNTGSTLPFAPGRKIAVIGPHADSQESQVGSYLGQMCSNPQTSTSNFSCITKPYEAIEAANKGGAVTFVDGCSVTGSDKSGFKDAVDAARAADYVVMVVGSSQKVEGESHDRTSIDMPGVQHDLIEEVAAVGKPTAVFVWRGGPLDIAQERDNANVGAIIDCGFPGFYGAEAMADVLFGAYSPGGRLSTVIYHSNYTSQIKMTEMSMIDGVGRGARYAKVPLVYGLGAGLSYSTFALSLGSMGSSIPTDGSSALVATVDVTNKGSIAADATLLASFSISSLPSGSPVQKLQSALSSQVFAFDRVTIEPKGSASVSFNITAAALQLVVPDTGDTVVAPGTYDITITGFDDTEPVKAKVTLTGSLVTVDKYPAAARRAFEAM